LQESFNSFFFKRLISFNNILKLSKKETRFLIKNNIMFFLNTKDYFGELNTERLMKINYSFLLDDYSRVLTSIITYTTTELEKITKFQAKRKQSNRIY
jgi:predicted component of type VI protein secretion system